MRDSAITAPLAAVLLLGILALMAGATYFVVTNVDGDAEPIFGDIEGRACATTGRWTTARFVFNALSRPVQTDELDAHLSNGRSTTDGSIHLMGIVDPLRAGNRIWLTTEPDAQTDIECASQGAVRFTNAADGTLIDETLLGTDQAYPLALADVECTMTERETTVTMTLERVPPGLKGSEVIGLDLDTGAATNASGDLRLTLSGGNSPHLAAGDILELRTKNKEPDSLHCTDRLRFIDKVSGVALREHTLIPD